MTITKSIGKNTLGGGKKMDVKLRSYNRSTHDLSYAWRSTMNVGTLVPFMSQIALPGDTWEINLNEKVLTHPTVGPLFGSYKLQLDVFECPIRLYQAMLHNNALNVGLDMSKVKLPKFQNLTMISADKPTEGDKFSQINPSCLLAYLGRRGWGIPKTDMPGKQCVPVLAYFDIFKNYYANKQEEKFYTIGAGNIVPTFNTNLVLTNANKSLAAGSRFNARNVTQVINISISYGGVTWSGASILTAWTVSPATSSNKYVATFLLKADTQLQDNTRNLEVTDGSGAYLEEWYLTDLDQIREDILKAGKTQFTVSSSRTDIFGSLISRIGGSATGQLKSSRPQYGLAIKTHQSDLFNNWINTEWIDGENGISAITAIDTSSGSFNIDTLNLSKKVYDMLNRIALSGGTYKDWIDTVYTSGFELHAETPIYCGGSSAEIIFNEVVATGGEEVLGTLAGRGTSVGHKNGRLKIKVKEPSYLIGIVSITPRVDYCEGNSWDWELQTLDDLHKPQLDGIGFQDLNENMMAWWKAATDKDPETSVGKQPAWINYMTNVNKTYGNFAIEDNEAFMCLNRFYDCLDPSAGDWITKDIDYTTYINPSKFNYTFAETGIESQNFWVQIAIGAKVRRVMSAKQIPTF